MYIKRNIQTVRTSHWNETKSFLFSFRLFLCFIVYSAVDSFLIWKCYVKSQLLSYLAHVHIFPSLRCELWKKNENSIYNCTMALRFRKQFNFFGDQNCTVWTANSIRTKFTDWNCYRCTKCTIYVESVHRLNEKNGTAIEHVLNTLAILNEFVSCIL